MASEASTRRGARPAGWRLRLAARLQAAHLQADLAVAGLLLVLSLAFFAPYLFSGRTFIPYDLLSGMQPWRSLGSIPAKNSALGDVILVNTPWHVLYQQALLAGEIPFWNPYEQGGMPFMANHMSAVFYPPSLLFLPFAVETGFLLFGIFHKFITGLGMYLLLRQLKLSPAAAAVGAVAWMFSAFLTAWTPWPAITGSTAWLPWALFFVERLVTQGNWRPAAGLALSVALIFLGGHIQFVYNAYLAIGAYAAWRLIVTKAPWRGRVGRGVKITAGVGLGIALAAAQLLPTLEMSRFTLRGPSTIQEMMAEAIPLNRLGTLLAPTLAGDANHYAPPGNLVEFTGYIGVAGLLLALAALFYRRFWKEPAWIFFLVLAVLALHLAYGGWLNLALAYLPGYTLFHTLARFLFLWSLAAAALAGMGTEALLERGRRGWPLWAGLGVGLAGAGIVIWKAEEIARRAALALQIPYSTTLPAVQQAIVLGIVALLAVGALLALRRGRQWGRLVGAGALLLVLGVDLTIFARSFLPEAEISRGYPLTPALEFLQAHASEGRIARYRNGFLGSPLSQNIGILFKLEDVDGYDSFSFKPYVDLMDAAEPGHSANSRTFNQLLAFQDASVLASPILDLLNVRFLLSEQRLPQAVPGWTEVYHGPDMVIYRNDQALPLATLVGKYQVEMTTAGRLAALAQADHDPAKTVVLSAKLTAKIDPQSSGTVLVAARSLNRLDLEVDVQAVAGKAAILRIAQNRFPGWRAMLDGKPVALLAADNTFQAVVVPAGQHQVRLEFLPSRFRLAAGASLAALLVIALLGWSPRKIFR